jgi:AcrR family transcriptional regulator
VSPATVVRAFGNKEALIDTAVSGLLAPLVQRAHDLLNTTAPGQALRTFLVELIAFQAAHYVMNAQLDALHLPATETERAKLNDVALDMVVQARASGAIRTDLDPAVTVKMIGECTYAIARAHATSPPELPDAYVTVLMDGLRPR